MKTKVNYKKKEALRKFLVKQTGCNIQHDWPCRACFIHWLNEVGLNSKSKQYNIHNKPVERHNEVWRAIIQIREE